MSPTSASPTTPLPYHNAAAALSATTGLMSSILGTRTASERSDTEDDDGDIAKKLRVMMSPLEGAGGIFGIMGDMWRNIGSVINEGLEHPRDPNFPSSLYSERENKFYSLYLVLTQFVPDIAHEITTRGGNGAKEVKDKLVHGRSKTRSTLVHSFKSLICDWHTFIPDNGFRTNKSMRGFNHNEFGRLLCPATLNWNDPSVRTGIREKDPKFPTDETQWPAFLWANEMMDPDNMLIGFLQGHLLLKGARSMLLGPSTAGDVDDTGVVSRSVGSAKPRAAKWNIMHTTPAMIACTATILHFVLSSQTQMSAGGDGGKWGYEKFFYNLVQYMETDMHEDDRRELLAWWDIRVFSGMHNEDLSDPTDENTDPATMSVMARMRMQAKCGATTRRTRPVAAEGEEPATQGAGSPMTDHNHQTAPRLPSQLLDLGLGPSPAEELD